MTEKIKIAMIGGTGIYDPNLLKDTQDIKVYTPFGPTSDLITVGEYHGTRIAFLARHGRDHRWPPHKVPYRANIWALKQLGVEHILAPNAVGSLREDVRPGDILIADQFFDFTKNRKYSFYDGGEVCHISVSNPMCPELRHLAIDAAKKVGATLHEGGTTVAIEGPRYSTKPESFFFKDIIKADIINMTLVPECILAREAEICYVSISAITDYDVWNDNPVDTASVKKLMGKNIHVIRKILLEMLPGVEKLPRKCECPCALENAKI